jgi:hypothetical protein
VVGVLFSPHQVLPGPTRARGRFWRLAFAARRVLSIAEAMDSNAGTPFAPPRLSTVRMARQISDDQRTPVAGPSRLGAGSLQVPLGSRGRDDDDDTESTPRVPTLQSLVQDQSAPAFPPSSPGMEGASDVSRLRAVLAKSKGISKLDGPNGASRSLRFPSSRSPSEPDSDFDPPSTSVAASFAQESLKDLFSKYMPDTSQKKHMRRRSSLESIEAESPRVARGKGKGKMKSLSDDEVEILHSEFLRFFCVPRVNVVKTCRT